MSSIVNPGKGNAGVAGRGISSAVINASKRLILTYSDGTTADLGVVVGESTPGRGIASTAIVSGNLTVTYTDGTTANLGSVIGPTGPAAARFARSGLTTVTPNWSTISVPLGGANRFTGTPSINIQIQSPLRTLATYTLTGSASAGWVCNITFTQFAASLAVLGALTVTIGSAIVFDIQAFEQAP